MKPFSTLTSALLTLVALIHLARYYMGWPVTIDNTAIPLWVSAVAVLVSGVLAVMVWKESHRS